jgi:beta-glucanase (GH16 family)
MKKIFPLLLLTLTMMFTSSCTKNQIAADKVMASVTSVENAGVCDYLQDETALTSTGWTKTFDEQFSGDFSKWNIWTGGAYNNELQMYQPANLQVSGGLLLITANKETVTGPTTNYDATPKTFNYTSGRIESKATVSASVKTPKVRMVARIKLPDGYGMWPAFWSYGDPWPTQGEIDCLEARGQEPFKYQTNYFYGRRANQNQVRGAEGFITSTVSLTSCWHVYEVIWAKDNLTFMLDGEIVKVNTGGFVGNLFGKTEKLVLNLAVGGLFFSNFDPSQIVTGTMQVDYVKVFTSK